MFLKQNNSQKGFTLVEVLCALFVVSIISCIEFKCLAVDFKKYNTYMKEKRAETSVKNVFSIIKYQCSMMNAGVQVEDNILTLKQYSDNDIKIYRSQNNGLIYGFFSKSTGNSEVQTLMQNVSEFDVSYCGKVIYIKIKLINNKSYERSFFVNIK